MDTVKLLHALFILFEKKCQKGALEKKLNKMQALHGKQRNEQWRRKIKSYKKKYWALEVQSFHQLYKKHE